MLGRIAMRPDKCRGMDEDTLTGKQERQKPALVGPPFRVIKHQFAQSRVRYHGLMNNTQQLHTLFALNNSETCVITLPRNRNRKHECPIRLVWAESRIGGPRGYLPRLRIRSICLICVTCNDYIVRRRRQLRLDNVLQIVVI